MLIAFDVDGTLIDCKDNPRSDVIEMFKKFQHKGHTMIVWSGGGCNYSEMWVRRLNLEAIVVPKCCCDVDIAVDDKMASEKWGKFKTRRIIQV